MIRPARPRTSKRRRCGVTGYLVVAEFRSARLKLAPYLVWKQNNYADQEDRFELLQEFLDLDDIEDYLPPAYRNLSSDLYRD